MLYTPPRPSRHWSDRRILSLIALGALIVTLIWRLPEGLAYMGARIGELLFALTLALAMTYVLRPAVRAVCRLPLWGSSPRSRSWATLAVFAGCGLLLWLMILIGLRPVSQDARSLVEGFWPHSAQERIALVAKWKTSFHEAITPYREILPAEVVNDPNFLSRRVAQGISRTGQWLQHQSTHAGFLVELLLVPVLAFYFLSDGRAIRSEAKLLVPLPWRPRMVRMAEHFDYVLDGYVRGQAWMCVIAWALVTFFLMVLKVPHAVTLGLIAGITRAVPVIGPILGAIPLLLVCLFYTHSLQTTGILLLAFFMMHFLESKVLLPKIVGHHVDLHPVSVIISLLIGMEFFGFIGVFLAVPIAAVLKIILVEYHYNQAQKLAIESGAALPVPLSNGHGVEHSRTPADLT